MILIAEGNHTKVYKQSDYTVVIETTDKHKADMLCLNNKNLPAYSFLKKKTKNNKTVWFFTCPLYYIEEKYLSPAIEDFALKFNERSLPMTDQGVRKALEWSSILGESLQQAIQKLLENALEKDNCCRFYFDLKPENFALSRKGDIILLDIFHFV